MAPQFSPVPIHDPLIDCTILDVPMSDASPMVMTHPGLPVLFGMGLIFVTFLVLFAAILLAPKESKSGKGFFLINIPLVGKALHALTKSTLLLTSLKFFVLLLFLLIIVSGLFGTALPERNIATLFTWNLWWAGLVFSILFLGSAWCAICPWNFLARLLVHRSLSGIGKGSLNLRVPKVLRTLWPALWMLVGLTWLELGVGVTVSPEATALLALVMVILATISMAVFERGAFCRFMCPVGRTVGVYSQLSFVALRSIDKDTCNQCKTLDCFHGTNEIEPCPTHLVMGTLQQSNYCTACGQCSQSCPSDNVGWQVRSPSSELSVEAKPRWDEAWFMLVLLVLTAFHGITMLPSWEALMSNMGQVIGDSGQMLASFSIGLTLVMLLVIGGYAIASLLSFYLYRIEQQSSIETADDQQLITTDKRSVDFKIIFSSFAFSLLPLTFAYHLAHNLNHVIREVFDFGALIFNPLGNGTLPLSMAEKHARHLTMWLPQDILFFLQAGVMFVGFLLTAKVIRSRTETIMSRLNQKDASWFSYPIYLFIFLVMMMLVWMLMQPMTMRL